MLINNNNNIYIYIYTQSSVTGGPCAGVCTMRHAQVMQIISV